MKHLLLSLSLLSFGLASSTPAATLYYIANLDGPSENPANASPGTGTAWVTFDTVAHTMQVQVNFTGLVGLTTAAHVHCCVSPPSTASVATSTPTFPGFPLGVSSGSYDQTFDLTQASSFRAIFITANGGTAAGAEAALLAGVAAGQAYFNIHTTAFGGGEIRGFLVPTPEPATWTCMLAAGVLLLRLRRR